MVSKSKNQLQIQFLEKLREVVPANLSLADELAELLDISNDSAYRRLRGDSALSLDEVAKISNHFNLSFDIFGNNESKNVTFAYNLLHNQNGFEEYLSSMVNDMQLIASSKNKQIIYAGSDVPLFHHFKRANLCAFKLFYWMKEVVNDSMFAGKQFSPDLISPEIIDLAKKIYELYAKIPSIEIWNSESINSTLKQIEFYWESGQFNNASQALSICNEMEEELKDIEAKAANSNKNTTNPELKPPESEYILYECDIEIGNNCILVTRGEANLVYLSFNTFNKLLTTNSRFFLETKQWMENMIKKSSMISGISVKQRYKFFKSMYDKIEKIKEAIEKS